MKKIDEYIYVFFSNLCMVLKNWIMMNKSLTTPQSEHAVGKSTNKWV